MMMRTLCKMISSSIIVNEAGLAQRSARRALTLYIDMLGDSLRMKSAGGLGYAAALCRGAHSE